MFLAQKELHKSTDGRITAKIHLSVSSSTCPYGIFAYPKPACTAPASWQGMTTFYLLAVPEQPNPDGNPKPILPSCWGVNSPAARAITTTRISRKNWNLTISPEKVSSWVTAVKDTGELLWSASFSSLFYYKEHINLAGDHSVFQALSLDTKPVSQNFLLACAAPQCYPGFPLELEVSSRSQKEIDISKPNSITKYNNILFLEVKLPHIPDCGRIFITSNPFY